ncbi:MAG: carbonic anhydrase [Planctomycetota bacterium]
MSLHDSIDRSVDDRENWALRRRRGIPNNRRLFVLTCMDERIPVEETLGLELGDAHIYRNAGALVTDDVIRSAALTTNFFGTNEIIILLHTECGMLTTTGEQVVDALTAQLAERGIDINDIDLDPAIPGLTIPQQDLASWFRTFDDVDDAAVRQVELLRNHPLIPEHVAIHAYIYETESDTLRRPQARIAEQTSTSPEPAAAGAS